MFGNVKKPTKPVVIRKVTVARPADPPAATGTAQRRPLPVQSKHSVPKSGVSKTQNGAEKRAGSAGRLLTVNGRQDSKTASPSPSLSPSRKSSGAHKRKAPSPSVVPDFGSSSDDDESSGETGEGSRKRMRPSPRHGTTEPDMKREVLDERSLEADDEDREQNAIVRGYDLTFGRYKEYHKYLASKESDAEVGIAELQYPSRSATERYVLAAITYKNIDANNITQFSARSAS